MDRPVLLCVSDGAARRRGDGADPLGGIVKLHRIDELSGHASGGGGCDCLRGNVRERERASQLAEILSSYNGHSVSSGGAAGGGRATRAFGKWSDSLF